MFFALTLKQAMSFTVQPHSTGQQSYKSAQIINFNMLLYLTEIMIILLWKLTSVAFWRLYHPEIESTLGII
jgi:hypothetical protein